MSQWALCRSPSSRKATAAPAAKARRVGAPLNARSSPTASCAPRCWRSRSPWSNPMSRCGRRGAPSGISMDFNGFRWISWKFVQFPLLLKGFGMVLKPDSGCKWPRSHRRDAGGGRRSRDRPVRRLPEHAGRAFQRVDSTPFALQLPGQVFLTGSFNIGRRQRVNLDVSGGIFSAASSETSFPGGTRGLRSVSFISLLNKVIVMDV